jgi:hypothetical protein
LLEMKIDKLKDIVLSMFLMDSIREDNLRVEVGWKSLSNTTQVVCLVFELRTGGGKLLEFTKDDRWNA